jgi:hypothetical protein
MGHPTARQAKEGEAVTADLRQQIRNAINQQARARRQAWIDDGELEVCAECGCDREQRSIGCRRCSDRHRKTERRKTDPAFLEAERQYSARHMARKVANERARRQRLKSRLPSV